MTRRKGIDSVVAAFIAGCVWIVILVAVGIAWYSQDPYEVNQARDWLDRARATNDLKDMAKYVDESLTILLPFHGNPKWWFPTPDTDFDLIKDNMREVIRNCEASSGIQDDFAYQQAVHNLQDTLVQIKDHVAYASSWVFIRPWGAFLLTGLAWVPLGTAIVVGLAHRGR